MTRVEELRLKRLDAMGNPESIPFSSIVMDDFEDFLLNQMAYTFESTEDDGWCNDGVIDLHGGLCAERRDEDDSNNAEYALLSTLQRYKLMVTENKKEELQESIVNRIRRILGTNSNGEEYDFELFFKSIQGMLLKTFIRRKRLNDAIRTTIVCTPEEELVIRNRLLSGRNELLRKSGLLSVKDDLHSKKDWPVLKLLIPGCSYVYDNEEAKEDDNWTRMVFGIEIQITGQDFMDMKENMHEAYEEARIDKATNDFLDLRPFQMGNLELLIAICRVMSKNGDGEEYLRISRIVSMVKEREQLCIEEGIDLKCTVKCEDGAVEQHIRNLKAMVEYGEYESSLGDILHLDRY